MVQKSVLITGTSQGGIGEALAKAFHRKGLRVFATARDLTKVQHLEKSGIEILPLDVVNPESIQKAVEQVSAATGATLDILVNNSGSGYMTPLLDTDPSVAKRMFDVNVFGLVATVQAFAPLIIASKGTVVNIGSILGNMPYPWSGWYNASKAAANLLSDQLRLELSPWGIKVVLVVAGAVKTKFLENLPTHPQLAPGSLYQPGKQEIEYVMSGAEIEKITIDVDDFADAVANNAMKANPKKHHWIGGSVTIAWVALTFGWSTIYDVILPGMVKLPTIIKKIRAGERQK